ncbi:MAG TPA: mismatch-specific DNA-glycosylase [Ilumatobacteraceae bacterium]|nr:mismatch-specific DNA-glycosylase [Ilumatobacteraceae bacterium]HRB03513.1 mismatch-specific DNA-glycosylase [Ilumatobacteraceae bacterium]
MARFTRGELDSFNGALVDDLVCDPLRLLFVGINPGLWTAAANAHFARRGNRFWPALYAAGITPYEVDASDGMKAADRVMLAELGIGITNVVPTASARADELTRDQLRAGGVALEAKVRAQRPHVAAILGLTAYRQAFDRPKAVAGKQSDRLGGAELWVLPNPSGLNAHETVQSLAAAYGEAWRAGNR